MSTGGHIYLIDLNGQNLTQVTTVHGVRDLHPAWSPDGRKILFTRETSNQYEVAVVNADGSRDIVLTQHPLDDETLSGRRTAHRSPSHPGRTRCRRCGTSS